MSAVGSLASASTSRVDAVGTTSLSLTATRVTLLPEPTSGAPILDQLSMMYLFQSKQAQLGLEHGTTAVATLSRERVVKLNEKQAADAKAVADAQAAASSHGFWGSLGKTFGTIAKIAGVVASIALAVCTFGAATPLAVLAVAGAVLSSASFIDGETHLLEKLGIDAQTAGWIDVGMSLGGAACSGGASLANTGVSTATTVTTVVAKTAEAGAQVLHGVDMIEQAKYRARQEDAFADALAAQRAAARVTTQMFAMLDDLRGTNASDQRAMQSTQGVIETINATSLAAAT